MVTPLRTGLLLGPPGKGSPPARARAALLVLALAGSWAGCGDGSTTASGGSGAGVLSFHAEQHPFDGFDKDTGYLPDGSKVQIRLQVGAKGGLTLDAQAVASGRTSSPTVNGQPGSGQFALDASFTLKVSLKVDVGPIHFEGPLMGLPDIEVKFGDMQGFDPFLIGKSVSLSAAVPNTEVAQLPLMAAAGIPGTLHIHASGTVSSEFMGTCAAVSAAGVSYQGETATSGMLVLSASVDIDVPLAGTMTFGPFDLPAIPIGPFNAGVDFGTQKVTSVADAPAAGEKAMSGTCSSLPAGDGGPLGDGPSGDGQGGDGGPLGDGQGGDGGPLGDGQGGDGGPLGGGGPGDMMGERPPADPSLIGRSCAQCPGNPCFNFGSNGGVCSFDCTRNDQVCGMNAGCVQAAMNMKYCLPGCIPQLGNNQCAGQGSACDLSGVCVPACTSDGECPQGSYCNLDLGDCLNLGTPSAQLGAPCASDSECPRNAVCLTQYPGGLCATAGCDLGGEFACPQGFDCVPAAGGATPTAVVSLCLPLCMPDAPGGICPNGGLCMDAGDGHFICAPPQ